MNPLVTIVTPTTGNPLLGRAIDSVLEQTYKPIEYIIVIDGWKNEAAAREIIGNAHRMCHVMVLPFPTGISGFNGHKIYGAMNFIARGNYMCYLDEDNYYDPNHIESLVNVLKPEHKWAYSLRKIVDAESNIICNDDCESLGPWTNILNDNLVDVGCYMLGKQAALETAPIWYRRARHPDDQPEVDRALYQTLYSLYGENAVASNKQYTLNYTAGNTVNSVKPEFFIDGNAKMQELVPGYPWRD
jgi:glycosyltransferase involved in cell wall biosynthesis